MKKLLLLGGSRYVLPVIEAAHSLGVYTITCDYLPDNYAHRFSDEYKNVSIVDKDAVLAAARELKVDGIMSFACDPGVITAAYVAEKLGLPSVGSYESVSILQNKGRFRRFLKENGFNVPTAKGYKDASLALKDVDRFRWPVIVKPTDSAGSKGVTRVDVPEKLPAAISHALRFSLSDEFIVEDYLEKVGCSSDSDSFSVDGELSFLTFNAQRFDKDAVNPYTPSAFSWPSTMTTAHEKELASELQRLIELLGLRTSIYNIETRECTDGKAYIMEVSPRGGGNRLAEMIRYATGVDLIKAAVMAAIGEPVTGIEQAPCQGHWAEIILHSEAPGIFQSLWVSDRLRRSIQVEDLWVAPGDTVGGFSASNEAIGTLILRFNEREMLEHVIENQDKYVKVILQ